MMEQSGKETGNGTVIVVDRPLSLEELPALTQQLTTAFRRPARGVRLVVATGEVGMPLIQLVCAAHRSAQAAGSAFAVTWQMPEPVAALLQDTGFTRHVSCPRSQSGECLWLKQHWS